MWFVSDGAGNSDQPKPTDGLQQGSSSETLEDNATGPPSEQLGTQSTETLECLYEPSDLSVCDNNDDNEIPNLPTSFLNTSILSGYGLEDLTSVMEMPPDNYIEISKVPANSTGSTATEPSEKLDCEPANEDMLPQYQTPEEETTDPPQHPEGTDSPQQSTYVCENFKIRIPPRSPINVVKEQAQDKKVVVEQYHQYPSCSSSSSDEPLANNVKYTLTKINSNLPTAVVQPNTCRNEKECPSKAQGGVYDFREEEEQHQPVLRRGVQTRGMQTRGMLNGCDVTSKSRFGANEGSGSSSSKDGRSRSG